MKVQAICPHCGKEIQFDPAAIMGSKKKTMTPEALAARKANASKPRPGALGKKKPRKPKPDPADA